MHGFHQGDSVVCMAPMCLWTTSGHAPDQMAEGILGDLLPHLEQGISELLVLLSGFGCSDTQLPRAP